MKRSYIYILILLLACFASRVPQLVSPNLLLDGDECVEALMAKHLNEGKDCSFFFYGQTYGFSFFETATIAVFYRVMGVSDVAVKLAMLFLWSIGILLFYKSLLNISREDRTLAFVVTLLFILSPAWATWAMKARGGYISSFVLTSLALGLTFNQKAFSRKGILLLYGALFVFIYECQPLFLPGLLPLVIYGLYVAKCKWRVLFVPFGIILAGAIIMYLRRDISGFSADPFVLKWAQLQHIDTLPGFVYRFALGYYFFTYIQPPSVAAVICAYIFIAVIVILMAAAVVTIIKRLVGNQYGSHWFYLATISSVVLTLGYTVFRKEDNYRYILPLTGYTFLSLFVLLRTVKKKLAVYTVAAVPVLAGTWAMASFYDYNYNIGTRTQFIDALKYIEQRGFHYAFSDCMLQWQVMFYTNERVVCRWIGNSDRYQEYVDRVTQAYRSSPNKTVLIYFFVSCRNLAEKGAVVIDSTYIVMPSPSKDVLKSLDYTFMDQAPL